MLHLSNDRKTAFKKNDKNSYGLLPGPTPRGTCPNATVGTCGCWSLSSTGKSRVCYAEKIRKLYKTVDKNLRYNTKTLKKADFEKTIKILKDTFNRYLIESSGKSFRIHWSGDLFSVKYASALNVAILDTPELFFWNYTRSYKYLEIFKHTSNLITYLSIDTENFNECIRYFLNNRDLLNFKRIRISYMNSEDDFIKRLNDNFDFGLEKLNLKYVVPCPVDIGELAMIGACSKCSLCNSKRGEDKVIFFKIR